MNPYRHKTPAACLVALVLALAGATQANADSIVQVDLQGGGSGRVVGQEGINCPGVCWADMEDFFDVVYAPAGLYATADPGSIFAGWGGACLLTGSSPTCEIPRFYDATRKAIAHFERLPILRPAGLTVSVAGTGAGTVTAPGIACPGDCAQGYVNNATGLADRHAGGRLELRRLVRRLRRHDFPVQREHERGQERHGHVQRRPDAAPTPIQVQRRHRATSAPFGAHAVTTFSAALPVAT